MVGLSEGVWLERFMWPCAFSKLQGLKGQDAPEKKKLCPTQTPLPLSLLFE